MSRIKVNDISGFILKTGVIVCAGCAGDDDLGDTTETAIITEGRIDQGEEWLFCDPCRKRL